MARGLVIEADSIGQDAQGNLVQAIVAESIAQHVVTYTTTVTTAQPFQDATRVVNVITDGTKAYIKFGDENVACTANDFSHMQPANNIVSYIRRSKKTTHVALYDGTS